VDLQALCVFASIVSGRNPKDGKGTEAHQFKNWIWIKPLKLLVKSLIFLVKKRWW
jgi:hypothetical protein